MLNFDLNNIWFIKRKLNYIINHPKSLKLNHDLNQSSEEADLFRFHLANSSLFYMLTSSHLLNTAHCRN